MIQFREIKIPNGGLMVPFIIYTCEICQKEVDECNGGVFKNNNFYCADCAFVHGVISENEYITEHLYWCPKPCYVEVIGGVLNVFAGARKKGREKDKRNTTEYKIWREMVFKRDKYTCQQCGVVGGTLNAHHIKAYSNNEDLRISVDNGITLCHSCHKKAHGKN